MELGNNRTGPKPAFVRKLGRTELARIHSMVSLAKQLRLVWRSVVPLDDVLFSRKKQIYAQAARLAKCGVEPTRAGLCPSGSCCLDSNHNEQQHRTSRAQSLEPKQRATKAVKKWSDFVISLLDAMSGMTAYAPWIAWAVVPSLATDWTQKILISSNILRRPTTREDAIRQSARLRACLVGGYLIYLFWTSIASHEPSAYALLGVDIDCGGEQIKKAFRKLAMVYHPDKVGPQGERFFIALRRSHDVLSDPVKRFAYDRSVQAARQSLHLRQSS